MFVGMVCLLHVLKETYRGRTSKNEKGEGQETVHHRPALGPTISRRRPVSLNRAAHPPLASAWAILTPIPCRSAWPSTWRPISSRSPSLLRAPSPSPAQTSRPASTPAPPRLAPASRSLQPLLRRTRPSFASDARAQTRRARAGRVVCRPLKRGTVLTRTTERASMIRWRWTTARATTG